MNAIYWVLLSAIVYVFLLTMHICLSAYMDLHLSVLKI